MRKPGDLNRLGILLRIAGSVLLCVGPSILRGQIWVEPLTLREESPKTAQATPRLSLPKQEFLEGEPIVLQVEMEEGAEVPTDLLGLCLKDDKGDIRRAQISPGAANLVYLLGDAVSRLWFGWRLEPGRYKVWVQRIGVRSDTLEFEVKPATGDNAKALRLLKLGLLARYLNREGVELGLKQGQDRELWRKIVDEYPTSVCAPVALSLLIEGRWVGPRIWTPVEEAISDCKRMLEDYPDFYRAHWYVRVIADLYRQIGKVEEGKTYLGGLVEEHPNPEVVERARLVLDDWEKNEPK